MNKMKKILLVCLVMLICKGSIASDNLIIGNVTIPKNGDGTVNVNFHFDEADIYAAFGFELEVPEGVSIVKDEDGNNLFALDETACGGMLSSKSKDPKFGVYTMDGINWIRGTEGTLMKFYLHVDNGLDVGTQLAVTVKNAYLSPRPTQEDPMPESIRLQHFTFYVTIGDPSDGRKLFDENSDNADVLKAATGVDVRVQRTINAGVWSTICLPFAMTEAQVKEAFGDDVELGDFTGYDTTKGDGDKIESISVNFNTVTAIEANHPYIIKVSNLIQEFSVDGVDIVPAAKPSKNYYSTGKKPKLLGSFVGTYVADFDFYNAADSYPLFLSNNLFYYATENTKHMKAFRAYFDFDDVLTEVESSSSRVSMFFNGEITGINKVSKKKSDTSGAIYDLQGRRVNKPIKGIFIKDGKKIVIEN